MAILGVIGYRLVEFWLPIPVGGATYLSLQFDPGHTPHSLASGEARKGEGRRRPWRRTRRPTVDPTGSAGQHGASDVPDLRRPPPGPVTEGR